jgi:hypothetical protein
VYHLQLRQFPHNHCQFNLSEEDVRSLAELWLRGQWLQVGERRWDPQQAKLTVIEAPRVAMGQLSMGRGWRFVERRGEDVTQQVLGNAATADPARDAGALDAAAPEDGAARGPSTATAPAGSRDASHGPRVAEAELQSLLGGACRAGALLAAWRETSARHPECSPSECLALAERQLRSSAG